MSCLPRPVMFCALVVLFAAQMSFAQKKEPEVTLNVGDEAPAFALQDDQGNDWNSADHYGKKIIVIYFYPADMTPGCTKQACGFRDNLEKLQAEDVEVVGISGDSVRNHQLFKKAHNLNFTLLADVDGEAAMKFGVPYFAGEHTVTATIDGVEESLVRDITTHRWTFVIGKDGKIKLKNEQVQAAQDSEHILKVIDQLKG